MITDSELQAFVDDELDPAGRVEVLDHLLRDERARDRVLIDLRQREILRTLALAVDPPAQRLAARASRLQRQVTRASRPSRGPTWRSVGSAAVIVALFLAVGSLPRSVDQASASTPSYLEEAVASQRAARIRQAMASQAETPTLDARALRAATRIRVPRPAPGWRIVDVQVFPSDFGPSVQLSLRTERGTALSLFATRGAVNAPILPKVDRVGAERLVAWTQAGNTYVLAGAMSDGALLAVARDLSDNGFA